MCRVIFFNERRTDTFLFFLSFYSRALSYKEKSLKGPGTISCSFWTPSQLTAHRRCFTSSPTSSRRNTPTWQISTLSCTLWTRQLSVFLTSKISSIAVLHCLHCSDANFGSCFSASLPGWHSAEHPLSRTWNGNGQEGVPGAGRQSGVEGLHKNEQRGAGVSSQGQQNSTGLKIDPALRWLHKHVSAF